MVTAIENNAETIQAVAAATQVGFALAVIVLTVITARLTVRMVRETVALRRVETDPHVAVFLDVPPGRQVVEIVLANLGRGPAYDVRCSFSRPVADAARQDLGGKPHFQHLSFVHPGGQIRTLLDAAYRLVANSDFDPLDVTVVYRGADKRPFSETFTLDPKLFAGIVGQFNDPHAQLVNAIGENTKAIDHVAKSMAQRTIR